MSFLGAFDFLNKGGWVAWVLAGLSLMLWYAIGYRFLYLKSAYLQLKPEALLNKKNIASDDLVGSYASQVVKHLREIRVDLETALQFELKSFLQKVSVHRPMIRAIVMVAPLLGLLGTVIGMIETFDSLQDSALFSQSGGIAGGISQALITTQMGLVVAIPGLLIGKKLDKKEEELSTYAERLLALAQLKGGQSEV